ncbi:hypothetical protein C2E23DRAFT_807248 [Lenzites betulinus]|nr:hypothetical protein C2E23DRAFT_807248 [Lenzites betulinus]
MRGGDSRSSSSSAPGLAKGTLSTAIACKVFATRASRKYSAILIIARKGSGVPPTSYSGTIKHIGRMQRYVATSADGYAKDEIIHESPLISRLPLLLIDDFAGNEVFPGLSQGDARPSRLMVAENFEEYGYKAKAPHQIGRGRPAVPARR